MPIPLRAAAGEPPGTEPAALHVPRELPGLVPSFVPIVLPVVLIAANTVVTSLSTGARAGSRWGALAPYTAVVGNPNLALLLSAAFAMWLYARQRRAGRAQVADMVETSLMSAGVIILITAAGGAFGATLQAAQIGPAIQSFFAGREAGAALFFLFLAFAVASLIKVAQGSSTVAMITTAGMLLAMLGDGDPLPFHRVYVATAIASGSLVGTWMNDSGFWVISKMGGFTELETLKSWTVLSAVVGTTALATTVVLALALPLR
jgi:gluconate:H+ symporter, GntP family